MFWQTEFTEIVTRVSGVFSCFPCPLLGSCKIEVMEGGQEEHYCMLYVLALNLRTLLYVVLSYSA